MHACCEILFSSRPNNIEKAVESVMEPYSQHTLGYKDGWWDWWQIGGRYTGNHTDYDPRKDEKNVKTCELCNGTGIRPDGSRFGEQWLKDTNGCNGCSGKGTSLIWPADFIEHDGDIIELNKLSKKIQCYTLIIAESGQVFHKEHWNGEEWVEEKSFPQEMSVNEKLKELGILDGVLVTVDYHS